MTDQSGSNPYRVLARKYRPSTFAGLIGQDALVRTLTNAIAADRIAHAFILTGVRGVGKTSTARIIARALNCVGPDGKGGPTVTPCGVCENCVAIAEDRHVDVLEMDAASRTGVGDIRDLIEGVQYRPSSGRYKIYIIDEVHMLSNSAFNALLKTLEEPPEHVKFIFATTEIRKVPVTVLSRCQRFDLKRVDAPVLVAHFARVAEQENAKIADEALRLIARAADGSVRDGLSLLDQAIAHREGAAEISAAEIRDMLGLADRAKVYDLYDSLMSGDVAAGLDTLKEMYDSGADPTIVIQDLLELTHFLSRLKAAPDTAESFAVSDLERERSAKMSGILPVPVLTRNWQILLKGMGEIRNAPSAIQAAEMVLIRLAFAADLPTPAELVKSIRDGNAASPQPSTRGGNGTARAEMGHAEMGHSRAPASGPVPSARPVSAGLPESEDPMPRAEGALAVQAEMRPRPERAPPGGEPAAPMPRSFEAAVEMFGERREGRLYAHLKGDVHLVRYEPGRIDLRVEPGAPQDLCTQVLRLLREWTRAPWVVTVSNEAGAPTLREQAAAAENARRAEALAHPLVKAALEAFPGAEVTEVRTREAPPPPVAAAEELPIDPEVDFEGGDFDDGDEAE